MYNVYVYTHSVHTHTHSCSLTHTQTHTLTHLPRTKNRVLKLKKSVDEMDLRVVPGEMQVSDP